MRERSGCFCFVPIHKSCSVGCLQRDADWRVAEMYCGRGHGEKGSVASESDRQQGDERENFCGKMKKSIDISVCTL